MGSVFKRGDSKFLWLAFLDATGKRQLKSARTADRAEAEKILATIERRIRAEQETGLATPAGITIRAYADRWLKDREERGVESTADDRARMKHALRHIGDMVVSEVRPRHLVRMVRDLEKTALAPRSVLHVYGVVRTMFAAAVMEELITTTPAVLSQKRGELPKKRDKDSAWRATAVFSHAEIERLISDPRIPERRRVLYAIEFLCGVRANEVTPRRWSDLDLQLRPLGCLTVATSYNLKQKRERKTTKTEVTRRIPIHPTLARVLAQWRLSGWAALYGRAPTEADYIVPGGKVGRAKFADPERRASSTSSLKRLHEDLELLGLRKRRQHDARRTFISLALADGASKDLLMWVTHTPGDQMDAYTTPPWSALCREVAKLQIQARAGKVLPLRVATSIYGTAEVPEMTDETDVEAAGIEGVAFSADERDKRVTARDSDADLPDALTGALDGDDAVANAATEYERRALALGFLLVVGGREVANG